MLKISTKTKNKKVAKKKKSDKTTTDEYVEEPKSSFNEGRRVKWCSYFEGPTVPQMIKDNYHMIQQFHS